MSPKKGILLFGLTEITIGGAALSATLASLIQGLSTKPANVLAFVVITGLISLGLGAGTLLRSPVSRKLLIFFAGAVVLSKILIFARIITLNGALETRVAPEIKNAVSIIYHTFLVAYFHHPRIKAEYGAHPG